MHVRKTMAAEALAAATAELPTFSDKRVLLLQGPVGPFFWNLAKDLRGQGAQVFKFNFNAGDWLFFPRGAQRFASQLDEWPRVLKRFIYDQRIDVVLLFGDCRPVHAMVRSLGQSMGFAVGVFEEGYLRPDHITFEPTGVNGHSQFPEDLKHWLQRQISLEKGVILSKYSGRPNPSKADIPPSADPPSVSTTKVGNTYWHGACWGMLYFFAAWLGKTRWNNDLHHRKLSITDAPWWWLSYGRKQWYRWTERGVQKKLTEQMRNRFFLVPLQVHNDAQVTVHSDFASVCRFIDVVMRSFAATLQRGALDEEPTACLDECILVFKHHPMDRGHRNYAKAIRSLTSRYELQGRVIYIHDQHLPSLLKACRGVVLVNSTTGLSALGHGAAVKVCGTALYDLPGLTYQGTLGEFWQATSWFKPQADLVSQFKQALLARTQLNGSFYRKLRETRWACGVRLDGQMAARLWPDSTVVDTARPRHTPVMSDTSKVSCHTADVEFQ